LQINWKKQTIIRQSWIRIVKTKIYASYTSFLVLIVALSIFLESLALLCHWGTICHF